MSIPAVSNSINIRDYAEQVNTLPELWKIILENLSIGNKNALKDKAALSRACRQFYALTQQSIREAVLSQAFGKTKWKEYFGDVDDEPSLPSDICNILKKPCPFYPQQRVEETHTLVLIPKTVNDHPLTLLKLGELAKHPNKGHTSKYDYVCELALKAFKDIPKKAHWVLMTKNVLPGTRNCKPTLCKSIPSNYKSLYLLDAVVAIFMHHVISGKRLFNDSPETYTRCESTQYKQIFAIGNFSPRGLMIVINGRNDESRGLAVCRNF